MALIAYKNRQLASRAPEDTKTVIELEKLEALRMKNAVDRRELVPVGLLEDYAEKVGSVVYEGLESLPGQLRSRIPRLKTTDVTVIKQEIAKIASRIVAFDIEGE